MIVLQTAAVEQRSLGQVPTSDVQNRPPRIDVKVWDVAVLMPESRLPLPASRPSWEKCKVDNSQRSISRSSIPRSALSALVRSTSDFHLVDRIRNSDGNVHFWYVMINILAHP